MARLAPAVRDWLQVRGDHPGPLLNPIRRGAAFRRGPAGPGLDVDLGRMNGAAQCSSWSTSCGQNWTLGGRFTTGTYVSGPSLERSYERSLESGVTRTLKIRDVD